MNTNNLDDTMIYKLSLLQVAYAYLLIPIKYELQILKLQIFYQQFVQAFEVNIHFILEIQNPCQTKVHLPWCHLTLILKSMECINAELNNLTPGNIVNYQWTYIFNDHRLSDNRNGNPIAKSTCLSFHTLHMYLAYNCCHGYRYPSNTFDIFILALSLCPCLINISGRSHYITVSNGAVFVHIYWCVKQCDSVVTHPLRMWSPSSCVNKFFAACSPVETFVAC